MKFTQLLITLLALSVITLFSNQSLTAETQFIAGEHYKVLGPNTQSEPILEQFFSYGCPACYEVDTIIERIKKNHPNLKVKLIPVTFMRSWEIYSKAYLIAEKLNVLDKVHTTLFHKVHTKKEIIKDNHDLKAFFIQLGISEQDYQGVANSYWLNTQIRLAKQKANKYDIRSVPSYVINKRYLLDNKKLTTVDNLELIITELSGVKPSNSNDNTQQQAQEN